MAAKYATTADLAERWLCSPDYVRMIIREGKLSAVNLGGWKTAGTRSTATKRSGKRPTPRCCGNSVLGLFVDKRIQQKERDVHDGRIPEHLPSCP